MDFENWNMKLCFPSFHNPFVWLLVFCFASLLYVCIFFCSNIILCFVLFIFCLSLKEGCQLKFSFLLAIIIFIVKI
jgi:hypothetical protein